MFFQRLIVKLAAFQNFKERNGSYFPLRVGQDNVSQTNSVRQLCMQSGTWKASAVKSIAVAFLSTKLTSLCRIFELWLPFILIWIISSFSPVHFPGFSCKAKVTQTLFAGSETPAFSILRFHSLPQHSILFYMVLLWGHSPVIACRLGYIISEISYKHIF